MKIQPEEKIVLLGASRGLGLATATLLERHPAKPSLYSFSRKLNGTDFSRRDRWDEYARTLLALDADRFIYFAGGGPYGSYENLQWKDHEWALNVSFAFPAFLLHSLLQFNKGEDKVRPFQMIFIGSAIAEGKPDPKASMYCAAKHALRGLISSIQKEEPARDLRLFSPGYMDTAMLPPGSWPRQKGLARKVETVAEELIEFMTQPGPNPISGTTD